MRYLILLFAFLAFQGKAQDQIYLFSYFTDNGQDGLHLAYSKDGLNWEALNNGKSIVAPTVGQDKLFNKLLQLK